MKSFKHGASRFGRALLAALALSVLAACGGSGTQISPFTPTRIVTFGDEMSVINSRGQKYTDNGLDPVTGQESCSVNPIWVQTLAAAFGLVFQQCNSADLALPQGLMYAAADARVADLQSQIDQHLSISNFSNKDLVTVLVGANDILDLYKNFPAQSQDALVAIARSRGTALADQVNRIANAGGRVIVSTLPDMGATPYAVNERATKFDVDRAALLSTLTNAFNVAMRLELINDGRMIGLVLLDETIEAAVKFPAAYGLSNVTDPLCLPNVNVLACTSNTEVSGGTGTSYLWATTTLLSSGGQSRLGSLAVTRAKNNPF